MGIYRDCILPHLMDKAMQNPNFAPARRRVAGAAEGRVLEIGAGSGVNLAYYTDKVDELIALDPDRKALGYLERRAAQVPYGLKVLPDTAESIPLADDSVDAVVSTLTLCSIPDHDGVLAEIRRVLRPGGSYLFAEHGRAPDAGVARWQDRLTPCTKLFSGGCHLNYAMDRVIGERGFRFASLDRSYQGRPKFALFVYEGRAASA